VNQSNYPFCVTEENPIKILTCHKKTGRACGEDNVVCYDIKWVTLNVNSRQTEMAQIFGGGARKQGANFLTTEVGKRLNTGCKSPTVAPMSYPSRETNTFTVKSDGATVHAAQRWGKA
jgi:hypothetical protein